MQQNGVYDLLRTLDDTIDSGIPLIPGVFTIIRPKEIDALLDRISQSIPMEIQEARAFLRRRDELQAEARQKAEKIIADAQAEAEKRLSEADFIKALEREGNRIRTQVQQECEEIKRKALDDAENLRIQATEDAMKTREGAELYAEQVLTNLEQNLTQLQQVVKNGQIYMEKLRSEAGNGGYDLTYRDKNNQKASETTYTL